MPGRPQGMAMTSGACCMEQQGDQQRGQKEDHDHLDVWQGCSKLEDRLGPASPEPRVFYFSRPVEDETEVTAALLKNRINCCLEQGTRHGKSWDPGI